MKNNDVELDLKFKRKINHLQYFTGMLTNSAIQLSMSQLRERDRIILQQQAIAVEPNNTSELTRLIKKYLHIALNTFALCPKRIDARK